LKFEMTPISRDSKQGNEHDTAGNDPADNEPANNGPANGKLADNKPADDKPADAEPVCIPINGELDLHTFLPRETARVIDAYIDACLEHGIGTVRIIHGKGTGALRETVHAHLRRHPRVASFHLGDEASGGWGATLARLVPKTQ
jgi:DNA-nicking Smr family endonuclease